LFDHQREGDYMITIFLRIHHLYSGIGEMMKIKLERIAKISVNTKKPEITSLYHHKYEK
jgi:hypothetical protein